MGYSKTVLRITVFLTYIALSHATDPVLNLCPLNAEEKVGASETITWSQVLAQPIRSFTGSSYLRPDVGESFQNKSWTRYLTRDCLGGALLPWVYTSVVLVIHIPVVVIRVVRWETVQNWCLLATFGTIVVQAQAFASTHFKAEQILTWTPLLLIIDAGSMAQVVFLLVDDFHLFRLVRQAFAFLRKERFRPLLEIGPWSRRRRHQYTEAHTMDHIENNQQGWVGLTSNPSEHTLAVDHQEAPYRGDSDASSRLSKRAFPPELEVFKAKELYIALLAFSMLITIILLQSLGLARSRAALKREPPKVQWCSPIFQPFGVAVLDGNCNVYPVLQTFNKGMGCIKIPGIQQMEWLKATTVGTSIAIGLQTVDVITLATVHGSTRHRGVKMRRPWCTMIAGLVALGLFLVFGVVYSSILPAGITEKVWVIIDTGEPSVWSAHIVTAGLRGALIGWNDGVFSGWGRTYFGGWVS